MEKRLMENLGISPSLLGFGCMRFPVTADGKIDEATAEKMLDRAMELGHIHLEHKSGGRSGDFYNPGRGRGENP